MMSPIGFACAMLVCAVLFGVFCLDLLWGNF
jgi:hypothetical protein